VKKILIASTNPGKITEIKIGLQELEKRGIKILTLNDVLVGRDNPKRPERPFRKMPLLKLNFMPT